ncbi:hypothetical protein Q6D67_05120 [Haliea sp. E1-2-M8]|uniref:hypothetical protein n=1 Tax=Haliea sp. E1-2-M8 TaxID=3064706 RepID=UPI002718F86C|nr:hypothetical protein [Haliea sp. E1-2-M8]MDO8861078.1 hypothetical protein [Haliea sp. E1-2-M8]
MDFAEYVVTAHPMRDLLTDNITTKKAFLQGLFSGRIEARGRYSDYVYDFVSEVDGLISGVFGSPKDTTINLGPADGWKPESMPVWEPFVLVFNPRQVTGGQRLFLECKRGSAQKAFARAIENHINARANEGWRVSIDPILDRAKLEEVLGKYRGKVNKISLDFPKANLPTGINKSLADVRSKIGKAGGKLKVEAISEDGALDTDQEDLSSALDEAAQSGARVAVYSEQDNPGRGKRRFVKRYDSQQVKNIRTRTIEGISDSVANIKDKVAEVLSKLQ